jgi:hypothetical protein
MIVSSRCLGDGSNDQKMVSVRAQDISKTVQIIGRLGQPLGSLVTIRGIWVDPGLAKDRSLYFHVSHVNGKELAEKVKLMRGQISAIYSTADRCRGRGPKPGEPWDWKYDFHGRTPPPERREGAEWELLGTEMGFFDEYSPEVHQEIRSYLVQSPLYRHGFVSIFQFIAVKKLSEGIKGKDTEEEHRRKTRKAVEEMIKRDKGKPRPEADPFAP